ncbi:MAG: hypothetical protein GX595_12090 [Lentisphaerae bacterium]|nr:hypothetical protein [Lentisphaerota bacterium]
MHERCYTLTLESDVVITADAATAGGHRGLDYIPGSALLGAAVAANDAGMVPELFLSGRLRFLNALPLVEDHPSHPIPLCFHRVKGREWKELHPLNLLKAAALEDGSQPQQWRHGYMTVAGKVVEPILDGRMKVAIDRMLRRSQDGQLFGYEAIPAGSTFLMRVQADIEADLKGLDGWFLRRPVRLGRSRSAEYGSARVEPYSKRVPEAAPVAEADLVVLYLESDLALVRDGMPVLLPEARDFGLDSGILVPEKTFVRSRRYSPWNAYFGCRMPERQVLCKGSVITFRVAGVDLEGVQKRLRVGVGLHREEGLGQIHVNPGWLLAPPTMAPWSAGASARPAARAAGTPLTRYLREKRRRQDAGREAFSIGLAWAAEWPALSSAIAKKGIVPSKSQWSAIRAIALRHQGQPAGALQEALRDFCTKDLRREAWDESRAWHQGRERSLHDAVSGKVDGVAPSLACMALYHAAVEMGRRLAAQTKEDRRDHR